MDVSKLSSPVGRFGLSLGLLAVCWLSGCGGQPELRFEDRVIDLGAIPKEGGEFAVKIQNAGQGTLRIESVSSSCSCTVGKADSTVAPGKTGNVILKMNYASPGRGSARVSVRSNDPQGSHTIDVTWFGLHDPRLIPPTVEVTGLGPGERFERSVQVMYAGGDKDSRCTFVGAEVNSPDFKIVYQKDDMFSKMHNAVAANQVAIAGEMTLALNGTTPSKPGHYEGECTITVSQVDKKYDLKLPVRIDVAGPLGVTPTSVSAVHPPGQGWGEFRKSLLVKARTGRVVKIVRQPESLRCELKPTEGKAAHEIAVYRLEIHGNGQMPGLPLKEELILGIDGSEDKVIVPISVVAL